MKPQCTTAADCLRELARVMDQFGINNTIVALNSKYVKEASGWLPRKVPEFNRPQDWSFAIAEVEGKPVFIGDELYSVHFNEKVTVIAKDEFDPTYFVVMTKDDKQKSLCTLSWNPPRPKTVMVEMLVDDAKSLTSAAPSRLFDIMSLNIRVRESCKKALEELK